MVDSYQNTQIQGQAQAYIGLRFSTTEFANLAVISEEEAHAWVRRESNRLRLVCLLALVEQYQRERDEARINSNRGSFSNLFSTPSSVSGGLPDSGWVSCKVHKDNDLGPNDH